MIMMVAADQVKTGKFTGKKVSTRTGLAYPRRAGSRFGWKRQVEQVKKLNKYSEKVTLVQSHNCDCILRYRRRKRTTNCSTAVLTKQRTTARRRSKSATRWCGLNEDKQSSRKLFWQVLELTRRSLLAIDFRKNRRFSNQNKPISCSSSSSTTTATTTIRQKPIIGLSSTRNEWLKTGNSVQPIKSKFWSQAIVSAKGDHQRNPVEILADIWKFGVCDSVFTFVTCNLYLCCQPCDGRVVWTATVATSNVLMYS